MKKEQDKKSSRSKAKKPALKIKKQPVKDLNPEKASDQVKGGQKCVPTVCINTCPPLYSY